MIKTGRVYGYDFTKHAVPGQQPREIGYWRDIGDLDEFYKANMEARMPDPILNMYNTKWVVHTYHEDLPPPKFVHRNTRVIDSIVAPGMIVSDSIVIDSILGTDGKVDDGSTIERSLLLCNNHVGKRCIIKDAIIDKDVNIPEGTRIGVDRDHDVKRGFTVSPGGIVVVPKGYTFS
jgi:glucose-1-phosphate adenylyltransferase